MTTRLVCRSAPLPTKEIAQAMQSANAWERSWNGKPDRVRRFEGRTVSTYRGRVERVTLGRPEDTDVGQCWSEEIFSMLEGER